LGAVYEYTTNNDLVLRLGLTSSNGLADNPNLSFAQLLDVDESNKGIFVITSVAIRRPDWHMRVGTWTHTAPHPNLAGTRDDLSNYGIYAVAGYENPFRAISSRFGLANEVVSREKGFAALTCQYSLKNITSGIGLGRVFLSDHEPDSEMDDLSHFETYLRWNVTTKFIATIDMQHLTNSNFDTDDTIVNSNVTVYVLRLTFVWDC
jgi:porin